MWDRDYRIVLEVRLWIRLLAVGFGLLWWVVHT